MSSERLRSGYDRFGMAVGICLLALAGFILGLVWLSTQTEAVVANPGYRYFGAALAALGLAVYLTSRRNGVFLDQRTIRIVRPLKRAVVIPWADVDRVVVLGRGQAYAAHALVLTDGTTVPTPLTERDTRLIRAWRRRALGGS